MDNLTDTLVSRGTRDPSSSILSAGKRPGPRSFSDKRRLFRDQARTNRLYRAIIRMPHQLGKLLNLRLGRCHRVLQHQPANPFTAGRRGQGARKTVVAVIFGQQIGDVN